MLLLDQQFRGSPVKIIQIQNALLSALTRQRRFFNELATRLSALCPTSNFLRPEEDVLQFSLVFLQQQKVPIDHGDIAIL